MSTAIAPLAIHQVETRGQEGQKAIIHTTLYELIAALQTAVAPDEDELVVATVVALLRSRRVVWHGDGVALDGLQQGPPKGEAV
jgi:hypothetical protein